MIASARTAGQPDGSPPPARRGLLILLLLCGAQFLAVLDATIVNVALPSVQRALHFTPQNLQWVASGYALTFAGFLLLGGRAADRLGRRRVFMTGVLLFIAASLASGLATSSGMLIAARLVQGFGGAIMSPAALSLLTTSFQGKDRAKALGIYGSIGGAGGAAGVLFGGLLTSGPGWRWVFFVNVPLGIAIVAATPRLISGARQAARLRDLDLPGAFLITGSLLLLVYGLTRAPDVGWSNARTIAEFAGAAALLAVFIANEARSGTALLPLRTFRLPGIASANVAALLQFSAVIPVFFFLTLYLQQVLGYSALRSGLAFLPLAAGVVAIAPAAARLVSRFGPAPTLAAGLVNTMQRVGSAVGLAVLTAVATARTRALAAPGHQVIAVVGGYDRAFAIAAGFAAAASLLSLATARTRRRSSAASPDNQAPAARVPVADAA